MAFRDTVRSLSPSLYRLRIFVFMCAGIVLVVSTYYFLYVRNQTGYFNDRNFRKLSLISSQIGSKITNAGSVMEKTCERFIRLSQEDPDRFSIESADLATKQKNINQLRDVFNELKDDSLQIIPFNIEIEKWSDKPTGIVTLAGIRHEGGSAWLYIDYVANGLKAGTLIKVQAKTDLNGLIQPFLTARVGSQPDQFQNILIAEAETARVIVQQDTTQVRLASVDKLSSVSDGKKFDLREISQTSNMADVALAGANYRLFSHPLKVSLPATNTNPPDRNAPSTNWIVTGLIKSDYFQSEAWSLSIPYTMLIIFGFVVAVIVFSWPFFKLVLVGPKDRFRTHDVYLLVFATMIVLAVVTAFGLYAFVYLTAEAEMDGHLRTLASDVKKNFKDEMANALNQLDRFSNNQALLDHLMTEEKKREIEKLEGKQGTSPGGAGAIISEAERRLQLKIQATCPPNIYNAADTNKIKILPCILGEDSTYPYFEMVAWIDQTGMQQAKWTVKDYTTQKVSVADRAYFQNIHKKHLYELEEHRFWLEPIVSRTTGRNQVEISQQVKETDWTIAFDTRLLSLMDPVLPDGFGYVIVNKDGDVLFHSDEVHHLGENLFQECDDNRKLRSAIIGRADKALDVRYSGEDHSFFVTTIEGFPDWSFVVFRSKQPLRSAFLELMTALTAFFLFHMLLLMGAFTVFYFIYTRDRRRAWLWPEKTKIDRYKQLSYLMLSLSFISLMLTLFLHGQWLVIVSAGLAWFGALLFFLSLRYGPWTRLTKLDNWLSQVFSTKQKSTTPEPVAEDGKTTNQAVNSSEADSKPATFEPDEPLLRRFDGIYALNLMLLVLLIAILPMGALFKYLYEYQATLFIKHAQFSMATALERRDERIRSQYAHVSPSIEINRADKSHQSETNILTRRLNETWDVYDNFFYKTFHEKHEETQRSNQPPPSNEDLLSKVSAWLPVSNQSAIERRGLLANSAVMGVCQWPSVTSDALVMNLKDNAGKPAWPWRRLSTSVPILRISVLPAIGVLCLAVPLFFLIHFLIRKVFLLDVHKPSSYSLKKFLCDAFERNCFVVVKAPFVRKTDFASSLYLKKFSELATSIRWKGEFNDQCAEGAVIAFDQFEYQMDDARTNRKRLTMLNQLVKEKRNMVLFSAVEPSDYRFGKGDANGFEDGAGEWADVIISNFVTAYAEDTDDRYFRDDESSFKYKVDQHRRLIMSRSLKGRKCEDVKELIDTVYTECAPRVPLQDVGLHILEAEDFLELTREHLLGRIVNQARTYYNYLWNSCSGPQKQTLCHLAMDGRLSHRDPDIQSLLRRDLIIKGEGLHLFNESFRKFVISHEQRKDVAEDDQKASEESLWQTLKMPILVTMIFVAGFLFWTQQDVFSSSLAVVTGVTGLISAVFKLMSVFHGDERAK